MPAAPKFRDRFRNIRIIKILNISEAKHVTKPNRHIGVSGKIKIDLKRISEDTQPCAEHRGFRQIPADQARCNLTRNIGEQHLLAEPVTKRVMTFGKAGKVISRFSSCAAISV